MEERKVLRLNELNGMLEDASFEIIGNPQLIGNDQWGLAIQLFRTKSLDSLVRYFASYLPPDHPWHHDSDSCVTSDAGDSFSPVEHVDYDGPIIFSEPEEDSTVVSTHEHSENLSTCHTAVEHPTRSNSLRSLDSGVSVDDRSQTKTYNHVHFPSQTMSIVDFDSEHTAVDLQDTANTLLDEDAPSLLEDADTPSTSASDVTQTDEHVFPGATNTEIVDEEKMKGYLSTPHTHLESADTMDSNSPTLKVDPTRSPAMSFFDTHQPTAMRARSLSSNRSHPHHAHHSHHIPHSYRNHRAEARQLRRREASPDRDGKLEKAQRGRAGRRREVSPEQVRSRARARRRHAGS